MSNLRLKNESWVGSSAFTGGKHIDCFNWSLDYQMLGPKTNSELHFLFNHFKDLAFGVPISVFYEKYAENELIEVTAKIVSLEKCIPLAIRCRPNRFLISVCEDPSEGLPSVKCQAKLLRSAVRPSCQGLHSADGAGPANGVAYHWWLLSDSSLRVRFSLYMSISQA
jgi:hypothetical protein